jgi:hypothetical protein
MVDETNPTNQFHPYQAPTDTPVSQRPPSGVTAVLGRFGVRPDDIRSIREQMEDLNVNSWMSRARAFAKANPGKVLGGLAALVIGAGLIRRRGI